MYPGPSVLRKLMDDIRQLDRSWSADKITMLIDGEVEVDGELHVGRSVYELRMMAQSSSHDFADLIVEAAQLDIAIANGIQRDRAVRMAMRLRSRLGLDEHEIEGIVQDPRGRPGYALLERGIELIRRHERGRHNQLRRVRAHDGLHDTPVCWRCLKVEVPRPGDWCGCIDKQRKSNRSITGPGSTYDPVSQPPVEDMTEEERLAEIAKLTATQEAAPIPGGQHYRKRVIPIGATMFDAGDLRRADREYQRGNLAANHPHHDFEQVPSK